jgi:hypothetical protein
MVATLGDIRHPDRASPMAVPILIADTGLSIQVVELRYVLPARRRNDLA